MLTRRLLGTFVTATVSCLLVASFFVRLTVSLFKDERIVFGR